MSPAKQQINRQTNRQDKNNMPPIIRSGGIKTEETITYMYTFTDVLLLTALLPEAEELCADETDGRVFRNLSTRRALLTVVHLEQLIVLLG